ncbi:lytic transglycosylase domain-containing protein [Roseateles koreensis]|uniref:Lytic transglycosylase domain-containing protein n=1 Tax=Roseateles koreensis TaxID=2987526 RepID=A0ABT5KST2_9BURK|nr:lytic transglycosylase domain-containing protein [Roseateles koreensis]MDC8785970.1 lytic transglycosylase domain-containing protein [Roseateles koreensis]
MSVRRLSTVITVALLLGITAQAPAHAELWSYVDGTGVAHLANARLNGQYSLVLGDAGGSGASPGDRRVPGKTDGSLGLMAWLEIAPEVKAVQPFLREAAATHGVDMELLKAMIAVESGYKRDALSPRGAVGLMQITAPAALRYADAGTASLESRLLDPRTNIMTGARMLADLIRRYGRIDAALAAWNAGEGAVRRAGGNMPPIAETQAHVHLVLELYWALLQNSLPLQAQHLKIHSP